MFKRIKSLVQRGVRGYSDEDIREVFGSLGGLPAAMKPYSLIRNASNLLGNFLNVEETQDDIAKAIRIAARRTVEEIGYSGTLAGAFSSDATATVEQAGAKAESFVEALYGEKVNPIIAEAYSFIAVVCYGYLGRYRGTNGQEVYATAFQLFGAIAAVDALGEE